MINSQQIKNLGLQTRLLHEQMATIVKLPTYFRENPFSLFINTILIRMAEAFRDGFVNNICYLTLVL